MIKLYNRKTKQYEIEKVAGESFLRYLYCTNTGKAALQTLIKRKFYSAFFGFLCDTKISRKKIDSFIKDFNIDKSELAVDSREYSNFNDFFTRRLKENARKFETDISLVLSPCDGRVKAWENIDIDNLIQVKGVTYSLNELLQDRKLSEKYIGGTCLLLRLAPVDYHRFHFVDGGICDKSVKIRGAYYSVNPIALNEVAQIFCQNKREYTILNSDNLGNILYVEVGATSVGSIIQTYIPGNKVLRGQEKGYFKFGGSTIILFFEKGKIKIDEEILLQTQMEFETRVLAGERIGLKCN